MEIFAQQLINGLTLGSIYGLIAIGYSMVFGIIGMVNFAHGDVFMLSAFIALILFLAVTTFLGISSIALALMIVLIGAVLLTALWGWAIERTAYKPLRGSFRLAPLISAIGVSIFLSNFVRVAQDPSGKNLSDNIQIHGVHVLFESNGFPVTIANKQILIWATTLIVLLVFRYIVQKTPLGRAQRACEQDRRMASLLGINVDRTIALTFVFGAGLAAVAGVMHLLYYNNINFADGFIPGIKAFTAAVLGGIGSLPGAVLGAMIIAFVEVFWSNYVGVAYKDVAAFSILAIVLIFMPSGILGRPEIEKV
ncbi:branched-chain amino acid ABC transporter permease LivH [Microvirga sp. W0021]|uniref:Branched-chain amino acid ABC transporter permease LivH n=1 Tax=Hohaiivirga grylli TaxID=3133970 RepID=A0ABV0BKG9_9HYPH